MNAFLNINSKNYDIKNDSWDEIWENPLSYNVLDDLIRNAKKEIQNGEFDEGGFDGL